MFLAALITGRVGGRRRAEADLGLEREELASPLPWKNRLGLDRAAEEDVVVEVEEVLGQPVDVVQLALDGVRVEGGQPPAVAEQLPVADHA